MSANDLPLPTAGNSGVSANPAALSPGRATSHPPPVIPMKRSLSRDLEPRIESPVPGGHHATPLAGSPESNLLGTGAVANRPIKTKARDKPVPREGGREKKESWKKKEAQAAARGGTPTSTPTGGPSAKGTSSKAAAAAVVVKDAPPGLQVYPLSPPKEIDYLAAKPPIFVPVTYPKNSDVSFFETTEHPSNRKGFRYLPCKASHLIPTLKYHTTEVPPYAARISYEDKSNHIHLDETGFALTTEKGFRSARANVGLREGDWYYECKVLNGINPNDLTEENGHVRIGFARRETSLDVPVGYDAYSYGVRDKDGQIVHMSRPKDFMKESVANGDVIGLHISLPPLSVQRGILAPYSENFKYPPDVIRDRVPIKYKAQLYFESFEYMPVKDMEDAMNPAAPTVIGAPSLSTAKGTKACFKSLPGSKIIIYKNGRRIGTAFEDLFAFLPPASQPLSSGGGRPLDDGHCGYYPTVSVFRGGRAQVNFGPTWEYPPEDLSFGNDDIPILITNDDEMRDDDVVVEKYKARAICERYNEQIAEDCVYDLVDEVDLWLAEKKAGEAGPSGAENGAGISVNGVNPTQEAKEIQEMHIDEE
ncbi:hypothetical protein TWF225_002101 [Orbilia oligospora]|uniref:B30.2/SPRY domain-containing protein n=1 Tax=Orbilia oligospora TaxID=2813651 RepID=A0A7C8P0M2_ORBOL|nr:hypothetical protein TWF751_010503 [Orbilia oligospora]KAF3163176.1 hypothetical protein TWF225_002101 [Orbilia oligospora]KAF3233387.1 hypothetical protein TWF128_003188 [Orbilia oligospora]KAF3239200.1 hypothetical protein TWF217_001381 [Orbilia oligospora]KAF3282949.1 hypothetical protein TWF132_010577 [Orbilia oligospora]